MSIWLVLVPSCATSAAVPLDTDAVSACDGSAASPADDARPRDIAAVEISQIDVKRALAACRSAVDTAPDNARIAFEYGRVLEAANDQPGAAKLYVRSAKGGYAAGQYALGIFYKEGYGGLEKNDGEARRWFAEGARGGNAQAQRWLAEFYKAGRGGLSPDVNEAARWRSLADSHVEDTKRRIAQEQRADDERKANDAQVALDRQAADMAARPNDFLKYTCALNDVKETILVDLKAKYVRAKLTSGFISATAEYRDGVTGKLAQAGLFAMAGSVPQFVKIGEGAIAFGAFINGGEDGTTVNRHTGAIIGANGKNGLCIELH